MVTLPSPLSFFPGKEGGKEGKGGKKKRRKKRGTVRQGHVHRKVGEGGEGGGKEEKGKGGGDVPITRLGSRALRSRSSSGF